jgi:ABC-type multidrug transport system fused ATPase/permease subunit
MPVTLFSFFCLAIGATILRFTGFAIWEVGGQFAAMRLFDTIIEHLRQVRTTFFDEFPSGKIVNRVVRDFDRLKLHGAIRIGDTFYALVELVALAAIQGFANPWVLFLVAPSLAALLYLQQQVSPLIQRAAILRSARFGEVLHRQADITEGQSHFVLYGHANALLRSFRTTVENFIQLHILRATLEAWAFFWVNTVINMFTGIALLGIVLASRNLTLSLAMAAVLITALTKLSGATRWLFYASGYLYESAGEADRIFEYVDLPNEVDEELSPKVKLAASRALEATLPSRTLEISQYSMSYRPSTPFILKDLSLTIPYGQRVGIIGRTGAGKSSFFQALFRMVYVHGGDIRFDNRSLLLLPIEEARSIMSVVPQNPYLFRGTLRSNLDPRGLSTQAKLSAICEMVGLPIALDHEISLGGTNLSVGERQLLCLARILLHRSPIVLMDEPTSSIDPVSDAAVQRTIREHLHECTLITIAHRLETLTQFDRIVEFSAGSVVRDGTPQEIIPNITADELG